MKTILNILVAIVALLAYGCSSVSPVSSSFGDGSSVVNLNVTVKSLGVLGKVAASNYPDAPSKILFSTSPMRPGHVTDTLYLTGAGPSYSCSLLGFERNKDYVITAMAVSADYGQMGTSKILGIEYNIGSVSVSIGNSAEVSANLAMGAIAHKVRVNIPIKGTPSGLSACKVKLILSSSDLASGAPYRDTVETAFAVNTVDTVKLDRIIPLNSLRTSTPTSYNAEIIIDNGDGTYYKGNSNIALSPSVGSSATITLVKVGDTSSLMKMTITMTPIGEAVLTASYS